MAGSDPCRANATIDLHHDVSPDAVNYLELRVRAELQLFPAFEQLWS